MTVLERLKAVVGRMPTEAEATVALHVLLKWCARGGIVAIPQSSNVAKEAREAGIIPDWPSPPREEEIKMPETIVQEDLDNLADIIWWIKGYSAGAREEMERCPFKDAHEESLRKARINLLEIMKNAEEGGADGDT